MIESNKIGHYEIVEYLTSCTPDCKVKTILNDDVKVWLKENNIWYWAPKRYSADLGRDIKPRIVFFRKTDEILFKLRWI